jgi:hypothetical protein
MARQLLCLVAFAAVLCAPSTGLADMMPAPRQDSGWAQSLFVRDRSILQHNSWPSPFDYPGVTGLDSLPVRFLSISNDDVGQTREAEPIPVLADGQSSFSLCLSALLGLGLCRSVSFARRLPFGRLPEWYYQGGPSQIGHCFAISPDCLTSTQVFCFVPPDGTAEDFRPQSYQGTSASVWRKSQFTPTALAARGPPNPASEVFSA